MLLATLELSLPTIRRFTENSGGATDRNVEPAHDARCQRKIDVFPLRIDWQRRGGLNQLQCQLTHRPVVEGDGLWVGCVGFDIDWGGGGG